MYLAEITDVWYRWSHHKAPPPHPSDTPYNFARIKQYFHGFIAEAEHWSRFFDHYQIQPIQIEYQDAVELYPGYLAPLFEKLGLPMVEPPPERRVMKTGDAVNEKFVARFKSDILLELYKSSAKDL
jgi:LPS sulfotransferase NodH